MLNHIIEIAKSAWSEIMKIYNDPSQDFELDKKDDNSPLTKADLAAHHSIVAWLEALDLWFPILSEEGEIPGYEIRKDRDTYRCIDPLDGTKEFIKRNGEFTVNIALIENNVPTLWVVYVPVQNKMYYADKDGAFLIHDDNAPVALQVNNKNPWDELLVIWSRSHHAPEVEEYVSQLHDLWYTSSFVAAWSSLKFCMIAEWKADLYPRFVPTMERDTAAAQCILQKAWWHIRTVEGEEFLYNKENLLNNFFVAASDLKLILQN